MAIDVDKIRKVLEKGGTLAFDAEGVSKSIQTMHPELYESTRNAVFDSYYLAKSTITEKKIEIKVCKPDDPKADSAYIVYEPGNATVASVEAPAILYSNKFSGCKFFLFRGPIGYFHGVHAHRTSDLFVDPTKWFEVRGGKKVCEWDSRGRLIKYLEETEKLKDFPKYGIGVIACVNVAKVDVFAFVEERTEKDTNKKWERRIVKKLDEVLVPDKVLKNL